MRIVLLNGITPLAVVDDTLDDLAARIPSLRPHVPELRGLLKRYPAMQVWNALRTAWADELRKPEFRMKGRKNEHLFLSILDARHAFERMMLSSPPRVSPLIVLDQPAAA